MSKLRSLSTSFWSDPFIEDLTPSQKLLFIYLVTNDKTNMLGIYESSIRKISFETGIKKDDIEKDLKEFEKLGKVRYSNNYVVLVNYMKHQNYNTNMKKSAIDVYNNLPKELKGRELAVSKDNPIEGFESLLNHYGMVRKVEVEYEAKDEVEIEHEIDKPKPIPKVKEDIDFDLLLTYINKTLNRSFKVINKDVRSKYRARIKDGYAKEDIMKSVLNASRTKYHIDNGYTYLTPEFFSRSVTIDKYSQGKASVKTPSTLNKPDKPAF